MEEVDQSGRKSVGGEQEEEDKRGDKEGLNNDRSIFEVFISSFSPDIIFKSGTKLVRILLTVSLTCLGAILIG